ncbi:MAG: GNAT family protein [Candidatus Berkelbacteria bacterium]|nr:GNAT family protein [Candidatus Berkelbacteria bacterium]
MSNNIAGVSLQGKYIRLRPFEESDITIMHRWRNDIANLHLWSTRRHTVSLEEFIAELRNDFATDRHIQMMIEKVSDNSAIGMIYSYNAQFIDGHCWITIFIEPGKTGLGFGAEAVALMLEYLFSYFGFYKVYADIYEYNKASASNMEKGGFAEEGRSKQHRFFAGEHYDLVRYAIYSSRLPEIRQFVAHLTRRDK